MLLDLVLVLVPGLGHVLPLHDGVERVLSPSRDGGISCPCNCHHNAAQSTKGEVTLVYEHSGKGNCKACRQNYKYSK